MKTFPLNQVTIDNISIEYYRKGKGRPLILLHGWNCSLYNFYFNLESLSNHFDVIAPNFPGNWNSQKWEKEYSPHNYSVFLSQFLNQLKISKANLLGHSMGARIALFFTLNFPEKTDKLILMEPVLNKENKQSRMIQYLINYLKKNRSKKHLHTIVKIIKNNNIIPSIWSQILISSAFTKNKEATEITINGMKKANSQVFIDGLIDLLENNNCNLDLINKISKFPYFIFGENDPVTSPLMLTDQHKKNVHIIPLTKHTPNRENPKEFEKIILKLFK